MSDQDSSEHEEPALDRLRELLEQPVVDWNKITLRDVPEKEELLASIIRKNPPRDVFEELLNDWIDQHHGNAAGGSFLTLYDALVDTDVDVEIIEVCFNRLEQKDINGYTYLYLSEFDVASLCPAKLQCLLSFLTPSNGADALARRLLTGHDSFHSDDRELWYEHTEENWERLSAIVHGIMYNDEFAEGKPFLEQYLDTLLVTFAYKQFSRGYIPIEIHLQSALEKSEWANHLALVAKFAPQLFTERNPSTGNTFLNFIMDFNHKRLVDPYIKFVDRVLVRGSESLYIPNFQGRTPFGHVCQNLIAVDEYQQRRLHYTYANLFSCICVSQSDLSDLTSWAVGSVGENAEPPPFLLFVRVVIHLLNTRKYDSLAEHLKALLSHVTDDWCDNVVDHSGNTALHIAVAVSDGVWPRTSLVRQVLTRCMTRQATMTRNKDGKLPIDLALEGNKQPWISEALSQVAPKLLENRNPVSKLYPFQGMAATAAGGGTIRDIIGPARLSAGYSLLRTAPHLVSTALTEENTAFLLHAKFVEASRLRLEIEREWIIGNVRAKDLHRLALEQKEQSDSRKRKRLLDVKQLVAESKR